MEYKECNMCHNKYPNTAEFFSPRYYKVASGERKTALLSGCRECYRQYHHNNHTKKHQEGDAWLTACQVVNRMRDRTKRYGYKEEVEWTPEEVLTRLSLGKCEVTGHPYRFGTPMKGSTHKNPFAPSPDRVDNSIGYTKDNTRFVVFIYNTMRSNFEEKDVESFIVSLSGDY